MKLTSNCQAVFFDAGGTLFRPWPSVGELYARVAERHGCQVSSELVEARFQQEWRSRNGMSTLRSPTTEQGERAWWRSLVWAVFEPLGGVPAFEAFFDELYDLFARAEAWRLYPETLGVLASLKERRLKLGVISNWDSRLFGLCEQLGVRPYLDVVVASAVVGIAKPQPQIFQDALHRLEVGAHEALHIGDSVEADYWGARQAGLSACLIQREGKSTADILTIRSLEELLD
ncbi:MAG: HAD-IA family hydrolase [Elusimicrobia bacterium]|nr:HAD-IA family hydrolase [Elusimicrobiota bacterium]